MMPETMPYNPDDRTYQVYKGYTKNGVYTYERVAVADDRSPAILIAIKNKQLDAIDNIRLYQHRKPETHYFVYANYPDLKGKMDRRLLFATSELEEIDLYLGGDPNSPLAPEVVYKRYLAELHS